MTKLEQARKKINEIDEKMAKLFEERMEASKEVALYKIASEVCSVHEGTVQTALIESVSEHDPSMVTGRLSNNLLVHIKGDKGMIGRLADVRLTECKGFYYLGELAE